MRITFSILLTLALLTGHTFAADLRVGAVGDGLPGQDPQVTRAILHALEPVAAAPRLIQPDELTSSDVLKDIDLLVLPSTRSIPPKFIPAIGNFLNGGGRLIACGLPLGSLGVFKAGDKWMTRADYDRALAATTPDNVLFHFRPEDLSQLERATDNQQPITVESVAADDGQPALHVKIPKLTGWDTLNHSFEHPFTAGATLTCFRARGSENTRQLAIEWQETDGSRWIATVPVTTEWKNFALPPSAFAPWQPPTGRGGPGDMLKPENAKRFSVGLAFSHTDFERGPHEYWLSNLGTAKVPFDPAPDASQIPHIEGLCPEYQLFPMHGVKQLKTPEGQAIVTPCTIDSSDNLISLQPRPGGAGFDKHRKWRWQPLLEAWSDDGDHRGTVAALIISLQQSHPSAVAAFTPVDASFYAGQQIQQMLRETASALVRGLFLAEGGSRFYTQTPDQPVVFGARIARLGNAHGTVRHRINGEAATSPNVVSHWPESGLTIDTELLDDNGKVIDRLSHRIYAFGAQREKHFIENRDGGFFLDGKPWKVSGVNYMPSSGIGMSLEDGEPFEHWIGAASYDPVIIQRDLERIKKMNLNVVSAFIYHQSLEAGNLLDFLRRCEALGLKVNLALRPGTPMDFQWEKIRAIIEKSKLAENDTVFAYDLAWEPSHEDAAYQKEHYKRRWDEWCLKKFGAAREMPEGAQWSTDGPHRDRVLAYRQFLDELLAENYGHARDLVRSVDPHHLVSFRMTVTGDPSYNDPARLPFDFYGLKDAVDIWEPEAYGRIGDWMRVRDGRFESAYARLCNPHLPLMWAEVGLSVWDRAAMQSSAHRMDFQGQFARDMYRLANESGDDGLIWWWYPGGYRTNEQSDFGIINPDGTDRPITKAIREEGAKFLASPKTWAPDVTIPISRDTDARGIFGIYEQTKSGFWKAIDEGKTPGLIWEQH